MYICLRKFLNDCMIDCFGVDDGVGTKVKPLVSIDCSGFGSVCVVRLTTSCWLVCAMILFLKWRLSLFFGWTRLCLFVSGRKLFIAFLS